MLCRCQTPRNLCFDVCVADETSATHCLPFVGCTEPVRQVDAFFKRAFGNIPAILAKLEAQT
jgi:hypothetical protein